MQEIEQDYKGERTRRLGWEEKEDNRIRGECKKGESYSKEKGFGEGLGWGLNASDLQQGFKGRRGRRKQYKELDNTIHRIN